MIDYQRAARIDVQRHWNNITHTLVSITYQWNGDDEIAGIDWGDIPTESWVADNVFVLGEFRLRVIARDIASRCYFVMQDGFRAKIRAFRYRLFDRGEIIKSQIILTFAIWGLAEYSEYKVPQWKDVHFGRKKK